VALGPRLGHPARNASSDANAESLGPEAIGAFLEASQGIEFAGQSQEEIYGWVHATLLQEEYFRQGKKGRGAIRTYMQKVTGRSRAQITRLIGLYRKTGGAKVASWPAASVCPQVHRGGHPAAGRGGPGPRAAQRAGDAARGCGARIQGVRQAEFARLAEISVSHLYN